MQKFNFLALTDDEKSWPKKSLTEKNYLRARFFLAKKGLKIEFSKKSFFTH